jgi:thiol-disulfide isomerase/thioredoxin
MRTFHSRNRATNQRWVRVGIVPVCVVGITLLVGHSRAAAPPGLRPVDQRQTAPELEDGHGWLNTERPLRLATDLKGHVVLLDFWTYCCINCHHVLPDLAYLEEKYKDQPFMVVGVHSAKFRNEQERDNVRKAVMRYEIKHPVIVDRDMSIWRRYGVRSWPTLGILDSEGRIAWGRSGEGMRELLDATVAHLLEEGRKNGTLAEKPLKLKLESEPVSKSGLRFPGKVLADAGGKRLFISDSNHNRIVIAGWPDEQGKAKLIKIVGGTEVGSADGSAETARFDHPQGMALRSNGSGDDVLYVADTENHLIRAVSLPDGAVTTLAGTGKQEYDRSGGSIGREQGLNSPWALAVDDTWLYIAMAGPHQLWRMRLKDQRSEAFVGSGRENIVDGGFAEAQLAQPSGLALVGDHLYFADSEVSAIREANLTEKKVRTIIGTGLFDFGDIDGSYPDARLQHALGVTDYDGKLLVADTYNHRVKLIDPAEKTSKSFLGTGKPATEAADGKLALYEPGGLHYAGGVLFVADTNNHRVIRVDPKTKKWVEVIVEGLTTTHPGRGGP